MTRNNSITLFYNTKVKVVQTTNGSTVFLPTSDTQLPNKFCLDYIKYNQTPDTQNTAQHRGGILYLFLLSWTCLSHLHLVVHVHCQTCLQTCYAFFYCQKKYTIESMYIFFSLSNSNINTNLNCPNNVMIGMSRRQRIFVLKLSVMLLTMRSILKNH